MPIQKDLGKCCFCVPLRLGVLALCVITFCHGVLCTLIVFNQDSRLLPGGYNPATRWFGVTLGCFGQVFGLVGILGVMDTKLSWIKAYNYFQWSKLFMGIFVFLMDMYALRGCGAYVFTIHSQVAYNNVMDTISGKFVCEWTKNAYMMGFVIDFFLQYYMAWIGQCYCGLMEQTPACLIKFEDYDEPTIPTGTVGEPANYFIDAEAQREYTRLRNDLENKLNTSSMGDHQHVKGMVSGSMAEVEYANAGGKGSMAARGAEGRGGVRPGSYGT